MSKYKKVEMTPKKLEEFKKQNVMQATAIFCACLMDEFGYKEKEIDAFVERFDRYSMAVNTHLLTIKKVKDIIEEHAYGGSDEDNS